MTEKTYGVNDMIDWNAEIPAGKAHVRVRFTGGSATKYGAWPAQYSTSDPLVQQIIEQSAYFQSGRIFLLHASERAQPPQYTNRSILSPSGKSGKDVRAISYDDDSFLDE